MRTCSQKNIEENFRRTEAGFHPECEPTYIDAHSTLVFPTGKPSWIDRPNSLRPRLLTFRQTVTGGTRWRLRVDPNRKLLPRKTRTALKRGCVLSYVVRGWRPRGRHTARSGLTKSNMTAIS